MRILILSDDFPPQSFGGAGIVAFIQAKELAKRGHQVVVITTVQDKSLVGRSEHDRLVIHSLYASTRLTLKGYWSLYNPQTVGVAEDVMSDFKPDVVHAHNIHQFLSYHLLLLARRHTKKVFLTAHDAMLVHYGKIYPSIKKMPDGSEELDYRQSAISQMRYYPLHWNPFRNIAIRYYLKKLDSLFVVSLAVKNALEQNGIKGTKVMHNGIDLDNFLAKPHDIEEFKKKHGLNDKKVMFFAGRIGIAKGARVATELLIEINKVLPNVVLLIAGREDAYSDDLKKIAETGMVTRNIKFTGWIDRSQIATAYGASDVVLTLSTYLDPFPTVNLEAMASEKPVIGTCFGGTPEIVLDNVTGYIVNPRNINSVLLKTRAILLDKDLSERMGRAGRARVEKDFRLSDTVDKLEIIYRNE